MHSLVKCLKYGNSARLILKNWNGSTTKFSSSVSSVVNYEDHHELAAFKNTPAVVIPKLKNGQSVKVKVTRLSSFGAHVVVNNNKKDAGLILATEVDLYNERLRGSQLKVGQELDGFVGKVLEDGKLNITFRPQKVDRLDDVKDQVLNAIQQSPSGVLPIGDKSSINDIAFFFKGVSKHDFKSAVGQLYKQGLVKPGSNAITLLKEEERKVVKVPSPEVVEKTHYRHINPRQTCFFGHLPNHLSQFQLMQGIEDELGVDSVKEVFLVPEEGTGRNKNIAFVEFHTEPMAKRAIRILHKHVMFGRPLKVSRSRATVVKCTGDAPGAIPIAPPKPERVAAEESTAVAALNSAPELPRISASSVTNNQTAFGAQEPLASLPGTRSELYEGFDDEQEGDQENGESDGAEYLLEAGSSADDEEIGEMTAEERDYLMSTMGGFDVDADFDPETEYYEFIEDEEERAKRLAVARVLAEATAREIAEQEPEDYNDVELYRPQPANKQNKKSKNAVPEELEDLGEFLPENNTSSRVSGNRSNRTNSGVKATRSSGRAKKPSSSIPVYTTKM